MDATRPPVVFYLRVGPNQENTPTASEAQAIM